MDQLNALGSIASVIGLLVSFYTLYKVTNLPTALKQQSRDQQLSELIDKITLLPSTKQKIPASSAREVEALIKTVRLYYVSKVPFKQRNLKAVLTVLEGELAGRRDLQVVQHNLRLLRDEITIR